MRGIGYRIIIPFLVLLPVFLGAQTLPEGALLVPPSLFVGDRGRLIVPLKDTEAPGTPQNVVIDVTDRLPQTRDVKLYRVELDGRSSPPRMIIDFAAYAPGLVDLPKISVGSRSLSGLQIRISSILESSSPAQPLSPPEGPIMAPGTGVLIYGSGSVLLLIIVGGLFLFLRGKPWINAYKERRRKNLALRSLRRILDKLLAELERGTMVSEELLTILSTELRSFLTFRFGYNFLSLTPSEFYRLPEGIIPGETADYLRSLFQECDNLRFSGQTVAPETLRTLLSSAYAFADRFIAENREAGNGL